MKFRAAGRGRVISYLIGLIIVLSYYLFLDVIIFRDLSYGDDGIGDFSLWDGVEFDMSDAFTILIFLLGLWFLGGFVGYQISVKKRSWVLLGILLIVAGLRSCKRYPTT